MDIKRLRCFITVAEELHFGRAAERLNMSQPPLSRLIKLLEEELGDQLFRRSNRKVELTKFGELFLQEVQPLLSEFDRLPSLASDLRSGDKGTLQIGTVTPALDLNLPAIIKQFLHTHPNTELKLHLDGTPNQLTMVRNGKLHVGFVHLFPEQIDDMETVLVARERNVLAVPTGHKLAEKSLISLSDMNGLNLLIFPRHSHPQLYDATLGALNQAGAKVNVSHKAYSQNTLISMVAANLGVCFTPVTTARHQRKDVVYIDVVDHLPTTEIHAIWRRKYTSRLTKSFIDFLMSLDET